MYMYFMVTVPNHSFLETPKPFVQLCLQLVMGGASIHTLSEKYIIVINTPGQKNWHKNHRWN